MTKYASKDFRKRLEVDSHFKLRKAAKTKRSCLRTELLHILGPRIAQPTMINLLSK